jgi:hypothetical protein
MMATPPTMVGAAMAALRFASELAGADSDTELKIMRFCSQAHTCHALHVPPLQDTDIDPLCDWLMLQINTVWMLLTANPGAILQACVCLQALPVGVAAGRHLWLWNSLLDWWRQLQMLALGPEPERTLACWLGQEQGL